MKTIVSGVMAAVLTFSTAMAQGAETKNESSGSAVAAGVPEIKIVVPDISLVDLKQAIADKAVTLLDCNGSKSYANGHIPGAIDFEGAKAAFRDHLTYLGGLRKARGSLPQDYQVYEGRSRDNLEVLEERIGRPLAAELDRVFRSAVINQGGKKIVVSGLNDVLVLSNDIGTSVRGIH